MKVWTWGRFGFGFLLAALPVWSGAQTTLGAFLGSRPTTDAELAQHVSVLALDTLSNRADAAVIDLQLREGASQLAAPLASYWSAVGTAASLLKASGLPTDLNANGDASQLAAKAYTALIHVLQQERECDVASLAPGGRASCIRGIDYDPLRQAAGKVAGRGPVAAFYRSVAKLKYPGRLSTPTVTSQGLLPTFQGLIGVEMAGASSTSPSAKLRAQFTLDLPMGGMPSLDHWFWLWGTARIGSIASTSTLTGLSSASSDQVLNNANSAASTVQSVEASGGFEINFGHGWNLGEDVTAPAGSGVAPTYSHVSLSAIVGVGALAPLSPGTVQPQFFQATTALQQAFSTYSTQFNTACSATSTGSGATGSASPTVCYVAFLPADRTQFFQNWQAGLRLKLYVHDPIEGGWRFPGIVDVTAGQNAYVTGSLYGTIVHTNVVFPLPVDSAYFTFSMDSRVRAHVKSPNYVLLPPASGTTVKLEDADVVPIATTPNRDRWAVGVSFDIVDFVKKLHPPATSKPGNGAQQP